MEGRTGQILSRLKPIDGSAKPLGFSGRLTGVTLLVLHPDNKNKHCCNGSFSCRAFVAFLQSLSTERPRTLIQGVERGLACRPANAKEGG